MKDSEKITLMLACGALHDIAEKNDKTAYQVLEVQKMIENIIPDKELPEIKSDTEN